MNTNDRGVARSQATAAAPLPAAPEAETDCDKIAEVLDRVETGEVSAEEVDYLLDHAQDCSPCFSSIDKQRLFIAFVQGSVRLKGVPAELANAIRASIEHESTAQ